MEESIKCVKVEMDTSELDDVLKKVEKLRDVLLEAKTLLDELASKEIDLSIKARRRAGIRSRVHRV